ncbi:MAG: hypothetical protein R6V10_08140 [bacterium]
MKLKRAGPDASPFYVLNSAGRIAAEEGTKSGEIRDEIELDEFVIMPNHFHAIVIIRNADELNRIRAYIADNPLKWTLDRENAKIDRQKGQPQER